MGWELKSCVPLGGACSSLSAATSTRLKSKSTVWDLDSIPHCPDRRRGFSLGRQQPLRQGYPEDVQLPPT